MIQLYKKTKGEKHPETPQANMVTRLREIMPVLQKVAMGDFSQSFEIPKKEDEFTELLVALNLMIDDLKEAQNLQEAKQHEIENKYKYLYLASRDAIMTLEPPTWKFTSGNPATIKMFGAKDEAEFVSHEPWKLSPEKQPDGRPSGDKAKEMIEKAMNEGSNFFEWTHRRIDGEDFIVEVLLSKVEQGKKTYLLASLHDITERKKIQSIQEKTNNLMVDRELKMKELKKRIEELEGNN